LNVQQVTSSIVYSSGSNIFGNSLGNTQQFTGSVSVTGSLTVNGALSGTSGTFSSNFEIGNTAGAAINNASGLGNLVVGNGGASSQGITIYTNSSTYGGLNFADATTGGGAYAGYIKFDHTNDSMGLFIGNTSRLTISSTGSATFSNTASGNILTLFTSYASGRALNFGFSDGTVLPTAAFYIGNQTAVGVFIGDEGTTNGLYVKSNGNVGIGTTSPNTNSILTITAGTSISCYWKATNTNVNTRDWSIITNNANFGDFAIRQGNSQGADATSGTDRLTITSSGLVTMGNPSPASGATRLSLYSSTDTAFSSSLYCLNSSGANAFLVRGDGVINTGTLAGSPYNNTSAQIPNLYVSAGGTLERGTASSGRFKENIINWEGNGLETILALKPKTFKYKKDYYNKADVDFLGLIAEDVAQVSPYLADYENEDRTGQVENVRYATIVVPLIKAIQELKAELDELKSKN
jgi:hypothetical protein